MSRVPKFNASPYNQANGKCRVGEHPTYGIFVTPTSRLPLIKNNGSIKRSLENVKITHKDVGIQRITKNQTEVTNQLGTKNEIKKINKGQSCGTRLVGKCTSPRTHSIYGKNQINSSLKVDSNSTQSLVLNNNNRGGMNSPSLLPRLNTSRISKHLSTLTNEKKTCEKYLKIMRSISEPKDISTCGKNIKSNNITSNEMKPKYKKYKPQYANNSVEKVKKLTNKNERKENCTKNVVEFKAKQKKEVKIMANDDEKQQVEKKVNEVKEDEMKTAVISAMFVADVITLSCAKVMLLTTLNGHQTPNVSWFKDGRRITKQEDDKIEIETSADFTCFTLKDVTDEEIGKYEVRIENQVEEDVKGQLLEPSIVKLKSIKKWKKLTLTWKLPSVNDSDKTKSGADGINIVGDDHLGSVGYSVEMKCSDEPCWIAIAKTQHSLTHTIQQLDPEKSYQFRVRSENIHEYNQPGMESDMPIKRPLVNQDNGRNYSDDDDDDESNNLINDINSNDRVVSPEPLHIFEERYDVLDKLGKGRYGIVKKLLDKKTGNNFAGKFIRTIKTKDRQQVRDEIEIMNLLRHPKLLKLIYAYESPKEMIMVTEFISGGELFERVVDDDFTLSERDCIIFVKQICEGVEYMHQKNIVHLDLKPENIMCVERNSHKIKIIDFGLAQILNPNTPVRVFFGTPEFIPPEIIDFEPIGTESDMWSIGVICYVLLSGLSPFMGEDDPETFTNITRGDYNFEDEAFDAISSEAIDFISSVLIKRKELRLSAKQCLEHPWLAQETKDMGTVALPKDRLKKFIVRRKWQKTGNAIRAVGRMVILSANSRKNIPSVSSPTSNSNDDFNNKFSGKNINSIMQSPSVEMSEEIDEHMKSPDHDDNFDENFEDLSLNYSSDLDQNNCDNNNSSVTTETKLNSSDDFTVIENAALKLESDSSEAADRDQSLSNITSDLDLSTNGIDKNNEVISVDYADGEEIDKEIEGSVVVSTDNIEITKLIGKESSHSFDVKQMEDNDKRLSSSNEENKTVTTSWLTKKHGVRTGSVSRTAQMFENEKISPVNKQNNFIKTTITTPGIQVNNERIRKAFEFWNK